MSIVMVSNQVLRHRLRHQHQVTLVILIAKEGLMSAVSPLSDVVRQAGRNHTCQSNHTESYPTGARPSTIQGVPGTGEIGQVALADALQAKVSNYSRYRPANRLAENRAASA
jgi:hypothetical protein